MTQTTKTAPKKSRKKKPRTYSWLGKGLSPKARLGKLLERAAARGVRPMSEEEVNLFLDAHHGAWPDQNEIEEFLSWLKKSRSEGRYR